MAREKEEAPGLRARCIDAAHAILREEGPSSKLELRKIAERAKLSRTAPYLVFGKEREGGGLAALQAAVGADGFRRLALATQKAGQASTDPRAALREVAAAYLRFAAANPRLYRLMFGSELAGRQELEGLGDARREAERVIAGVVRRCQDGGVIKAGDPARFAASVWAMIHGYATGILDAEPRPGIATAGPHELAEMLADDLLDGLGESHS